MKDKSGQQDKDLQEGSGLKTAGPEGEITAGFNTMILTFILWV